MLLLATFMLAWILETTPLLSHKMVNCLTWMSVQKFSKLFYNFLIKTPISYYHTYKQALDKDKNSEDKRIKVEKTKANILIFAGENDRMWPSAESARLIEKYQPNHTQVTIYKEAGHLFAGDGIVDSRGIYLSVGGNKAANETAKKDSDQRLKNS